MEDSDKSSFGGVEEAVTGQLLVYLVYTAQGNSHLFHAAL